MIKKPNGYGSVYKLSGKRRRPWVAAVTKGYEWQLDGQPITDFKALSADDQSRCKAVQKRAVLGYYSNRKDAEIALADYNKKPYDLELRFKDVYKRWSEQKFSTISQGSADNYQSAYNHLSALHNRKFADLKTFDLENAIIKSKAGKSVQSRMKILLNQLYKYALKYDIVQVDYSARFSVAQAEAKIERRPFTDEEIATLWADDSVWAKVSLILIYTGMRVMEIKAVEYDSSLQAFKGGLKTSAGRDRIIPIRSKIMPLIGIVGSLVSYSSDAYYKAVSSYLKKMGHTTHDCRVTFATRYKTADPIAVKLIMGHKINDITKSVYTKYTAKELLTVVESIDF